MAARHLTFSTEEVLRLFESNELASEQQDTLEETFTSYVGVDMSEPEADNDEEDSFRETTLNSPSTTGEDDFKGLHKDCSSVNGSFSTPEETVSVVQSFIPLPEDHASVANIDPWMSSDSEDFDDFPTI